MGLHKDCEISHPTGWGKLKPGCSTLIFLCLPGWSDVALCTCKLLASVSHCILGYRAGVRDGNGPVNALQVSTWFKGVQNPRAAAERSPCFMLTRISFPLDFGNRPWVEQEPSTDTAQWWQLQVCIWKEACISWVIKGGGGGELRSTLHRSCNRALSSWWHVEGVEILGYFLCVFFLSPTSVPMTMCWALASFFVFHLGAFLLWALGQLGERRQFWLW